jgi:hypothetical protein
MTVPPTPTVIVLGSSAAGSDACTGTALPINLSHGECRPSHTRRLMQSRRTALERRTRAQSNRLPLPGTDPAPTTTATEPRPLFP